MATRRVPSTDEEIRAYTIGELKPLATPIRLVEYNPQWPELYQREAARKRATQTFSKGCLSRSTSTWMKIRRLCLCSSAASKWVIRSRINR